MSSRLSVSLYRRVFRLLTSIKNIGAEPVAMERYAEYLPPTLILEKNDSLLAVARKVFLTTPYTPEALSNGFSFIKDAIDSLPDLELLALWHAYRLGGEYDLLYGIALVSAALKLSGSRVPPRMGDLTTAVANLKAEVEHLTTEIKDLFEDKKPSSGKCGVKRLVPSILAAMSELKKRGYCVSEGSPEDYAVINMSRNKHGCTLLFNALFVVALLEHGVLCTVVGTDSLRSWLRVQKEGGRPIFLSFDCMDAYTTKELERLNYSNLQNTPKWCRSSEWNAQCRKHILSTLLKRQLLALSSATNNPLRLQQQKFCRIQILFLLS
ncbi:uncharacterized protein TM35_000411080 [Trypanosoma theileri]|uniref:Protein SirB1 N-terminal domain-containing protein n=1 Tax=Trypanosoma theileri TaxID=67003 RepID=A0A1X0NJP2_9TRYP|nr:uncharacterized protein TM35_000411080 [Trypanosoma theileri]ORC84738.1 hypothetical protein TM35_000411080 [Trypanosoma theileri]